MLETNGKISVLRGKQTIKITKWEYEKRCIYNIYIF